MLVVGIGIGLVMQVLVLVVQNDAPAADIGVATSTATFFRSMGGAIGVAMFGALLRHSNTTNIPAAIERFHVPPSQLTPANLNIGSPEQVSALPNPLHLALVTGFAESMQTVFLSAAPFAVLGFVVVCFLREHRLRTRETAPVDVPDSSFEPGEELRREEHVSRKPAGQAAG
jgi:hypothetical protein